MTPHEVEQAIERDYIAPITNRSHFYNQVREHMSRYIAFADFTYPYVDGQTCNLEDYNDDFQKIGYVKARVATTLWITCGGSLNDPGYIGALQMILRHCRLIPAAQRFIEDTISASHGNSATASATTTENTMNNTSNAQAFSTVSYVYGRAVGTLNEAELISAIKGVEAEIKELGKVETGSTKIAAKVDELKAMLAQIVTALDAK